MSLSAQEGHAIDSGEVRGTQSFVHTLSWCWQRPSLLGLELLWRWLFGVPALWVLWKCWLRVLAETQFDWTSVTRLTVTQPLGTAAALASDAASLAPPVLHIARWLAPLMMAVWVIVSSLGRTLVLRRADPRLQARPGTLMVLAVIRIAALAAAFWAWFAGIEWDAHVAVQQPLARMGEPNLVLYFALLIVGTLFIFVLWAAVSWVFSVAPLLAMLRGLGPGRSMRAAFELGPLKGKLVEINLVMGIVKIALIVLGLVFSACPLPFSSNVTQEFLNWWWVGVTVLYLAGSDFFHVARLVAYLNLWREFEPKN
jgi:hypothetical protein